MGNIPYLDLNSRNSMKDMFSYAGKTVLVTGAAGQIGYMSAAGFAELGADVIISDLEQARERCEAAASEIAEKFQVSCRFIPADVTEPESVRRLYAEIENEFQQLDVVHSNVGVSFPGDHGGVSPDIWNKTFSINTTGTLLVDQGACELMRKTGRKGAIVNTASMSGFIINRQKEPYAHEVAYPASKAAVLHLTRGLAMEYIKYHVRVNSVSPGYVFSSTHERSSEEKLKENTADIPMKRFARADEITGAVLYLCSDLASYVTGSDLRLDGGYTTW